MNYEQIFTFIKKLNKNFCQNDAFDIKTFDSEKLEKLAEKCCDPVNCSFKSEIFPECEKNASVIQIFQTHIGLIQYIVFIQSNRVCLLRAVTEAHE